MQLSRCAPGGSPGLRAVISDGALEAGCCGRRGRYADAFQLPFSNVRLEFSRVLPRKEVIQPHLPVRLPCYDFTPLTLHTFDASLTRLGRRLRVQTTRVV